eukprot:gene335-447_t
MASSSIRRASHRILRPKTACPARRFSELAGQAGTSHGQDDVSSRFDLMFSEAGAPRRNEWPPNVNGSWQQQLSLATTQEEIDQALDLVEKMRELQKDRCEWSVHKFSQKLMK